MRPHTRKYTHEELYEKCAAILGGTEKTIARKVQHVPDFCPYCSKDNEKDFHCSFGPIFHNGGFGFKCFVCGETVGIYKFAKFIGVDLDDYVPPKPVNLRRVPKVSDKAPPYWYEQRDRILGRIHSHKDRYESWYSYKRLTEPIVDDYGLGTGVLPGTQFKDHRLITPFFAGDDPVWFRGRGEKGWIGSYGVSPRDIRLPLIDRVTTGAEVVLMTENYVDGILVNEFTPYQAVSVLGVSYWFDSWQEQLIAKKPKLVIVAFDADLAGNMGTREGLRNAAITRTKAWARVKGHEDAEVAIRRIMETERGWDVDTLVNGSIHHTMRIPTPYGVKRVNQLRRVGLDAVLFPWKKQDMGRDIGSLFLDSLKEA